MAAAGLPAVGFAAHGGSRGSQQLLQPGERAAEVGLSFPGFPSPSHGGTHSKNIANTRAQARAPTARARKRAPT